MGCLIFAVYIAVVFIVMFQVDTGSIFGDIVCSIFWPILVGTIAYATFVDLFWKWIGKEK